MRNISKISSWKYPVILLFGIGISNLGMWVYFIALNVLVFNMTSSALAVTALYLIRPLATVFTNLWSGSVIDRTNKKYLMVLLDIIQGALILCLAYFSSLLWIIYILVFFINMASSIYGPTSTNYITRLIPVNQRQKFNSWRSLLGSGAFFLGPAITGVLFLVGTPVLAIYINAVAFFFSAIITMFMPNLENEKEENTEKLSFHLFKTDWNVVFQFSKNHLYVMTIYFLFSAFIVMQTAIDSLEVAFSKEVILLSDSEYGFLVSIAGAGILIGALINVLFTKKLSIPFMIGGGSVVVALGYIIFSFSTSFSVASIGVFLLAFASAFANTGFQTFYQNNIPVEVMGRIGSLYGFVEAFLIIVVTSVFGITAQFVSIKFTVVSGAFITLLLTGFLLFLNLTSKQKYYRAISGNAKNG
ncbi:MULTISPECIES: MFS transporter [Sutcliffiella]|uniref:MFS transporter n=1 Tax=Sutcliffiella cohnii TaxID=33932 RepID=A0A223KK55_9BACI|nr:MULTISPECIES: MFS transporter [Sutcliffiella]AST89776.1 MFS transporter [Sutcliffiella cohnii]WBL15401.1 MFS transporter [Sutcliffiella sp. NC1]